MWQWACRLKEGAEWIPLDRESRRKFMLVTENNYVGAF
jgi:hypothetical protein